MRRIISTALVTGCLSAATVAGAFSVGAAAAAGPAAVAAGSLTLNERATLHKTSSHGLTLNEEGSVSGAIKGTIYIHLHVESSRVSAEVNIYPSNGSLTGYASASYRVVGAYASFSGTMSVARGRGRYAHAHASGLRFAGSIKRINDATTVEVSGKLYD